MRIRCASHDESAQLAALGRDSYRDHFAAMWRRDEMDAWLDTQFDPTTIGTEIAAGQAIYLVCEVDGDAAGFAKIRWAQPVPLSAHSGAELQKIYFRTRHAGHGYGGRLLDACIGRVGEHGETCLWLDVLKSNERATKLYQRAGFAIAGERDFRRGDDYLPMWVMLRPLGPTAATG